MLKRTTRQESAPQADESPITELLAKIDSRYLKSGEWIREIERTANLIATGLDREALLLLLTDDNLEEFRKVLLATYIKYLKNRGKGERGDRITENIFNQIIFSHFKQAFFAALQQRFSQEQLRAQDENRIGLNALMSKIRRQISHATDEGLICIE